MKPCYQLSYLALTKRVAYHFFEETEKVKDQVGMPFEYLFINDGSSDQTLAVMRKLHQEHPESVRYLSFSRNFGKEAALYAGLKAAKGDFVTVMDADLQDPPSLFASDV